MRRLAHAGALRRDAMIAIIDAAVPLALDYYWFYRKEPNAAGRLMTIDDIAFIPNISFEKVLERILESSDRRFLIVGHSWPQDGSPPTGLQMSLTEAFSNESTVDDLEKVVQVCDALLQPLPPRSESEALQRLLPSRKAWLDKVALEVGINDPRRLVQLAWKLFLVRERRLDLVELRSCSLGENPQALFRLGRILNAQQIAAPLLTCFFARLDPDRRFSHDSFQSWLIRHPGAQVFTSPNRNGRFALRPRHVQRRTTNWVLESAMESVEAAQDFIDRYVTPGRPYHGGPFVLTGLWTYQISPKPFISPQMPEYRRLIYTTRSITAEL
jgi:hypothetical protein